MNILILILLIVILATVFLLLKKVVALSERSPNTSNEIGEFPDKPVKGTDTVFVGLYLDDKGEVKSTTKKEIVHPGQKVLFSSANAFDIKFRDHRSPNGKICNPADKNGVLMIKIPKNIFELDEFAREYKDKDEIIFNYDIKMGDKTLDPPMIVRRK